MVLFAHHPSTCANSNLGCNFNFWGSINQSGSEGKEGMASKVCGVILHNANFRGIFYILWLLEMGPLGLEKDASFTFKDKKNRSKYLLAMLRSDVIRF